MAAAMGGFDALVFTGGAGEGDPLLRADTCGGLGFLGVRPLPPSDDERAGDRLVSAIGSSTAVLVVSAREDLEIARHVRSLLER